MMSVAAHTVNAWWNYEPAVLTTVGGLDLAATVDRIVGWGGDESRYVDFLTRGLNATKPTATNARALGVVAGWRSGVVDLRDEALSRIDDLDAGAAAAALGLTTEQIDEFVSAQKRDPFAWPEQERLIARIGGFRGLGGTWVAPPTGVRFIAANTIEIACGAEFWLAVVDVFGARIVPAKAKASTNTVTATAVAVVSESSYLVDIVRAES